MSVAAVTQFPNSFIAGDAVRVTIANPNYPSSLWTLKVWFQNGITVQSFTAPAGSADAYDLFITPEESAAIPAGQYLIAYIFTEIASPNDRKSLDWKSTVAVYANPAVATAKTVARQTLEAMEAAYLSLSSGGLMQSVNFNGQSFTNHNLSDFATAIERQRAIVAGEDAARLGHRRISSIFHPL
jgi:hypothetical protein